MYQQYINEARAGQHEQDLQQEAATERALRAAQQEQQEQQESIAPEESEASYPRRLLRALADLI